VFLSAAVGLGFVIGRALRAGTSAQQSGGTAAGSMRTPTTPTPSTFAEHRLMPVGAGSTAPVSGVPQ
jgi:hypothetical protein